MKTGYGERSKWRYEEIISESPVGDMEVTGHRETGIPQTFTMMEVTVIKKGEIDRL